MGTSALRAMAFGSSLIVQGERGFWELLSPETEPHFMWVGFYGIGNGPQEGPQRLKVALDKLLAEPGLRGELGRYGRELVERRFSLDRAADIHLDIYERAIAEAPVRPTRWLGPGAVTAAGLAAYRFKRRVELLRGSSRLDDFNSKPVAAIASGVPKSA